MRIIVCGSRDWTDRVSIQREIVRMGAPLVIIHGAAPGADTIAHDFASSILHDVIAFPADWSLGRKAGPIRNGRMLKEGKPDRGLAFGALWYRDCSKWKRTGTGDMVHRMVSAGLPVRWIAAPDVAAMDLDLGVMPGPPQ